MDLMRVPKYDLAEIKILPEATQERDRLLARARLVGPPKTPKAKEISASMAKALRQALAAAEAARSEVKAPVISAEKAIDGMAAMFRKPLLEELQRIEGALSFQIQKEREEEAAAKAKAAEEQRAREAEAAREAKKISDAAKAQAAKERDAVAAQQVLDMAALNAKQVVAQAAAPPPTVIKAPFIPTGVRVQEPWTFEVLDLKALADHDWGLIRAEANTAEVMALIRAGIRELPGIRIFQRFKAGTTV